MQVRDVMSKDVHLIDPDATLRQAAQEMKKIDAGVLPVADRDRLCGIITDRDIAVRAIADGKGPETKVRDIMSAEVKYCFEDEDVSHIAKNLAELQVRRLPVVNREKRLAGIITLADIARQGQMPEMARAMHGISKPGGQHNQSRAA